jgi:hypothetical protein
MRQKIRDTVMVLVVVGLFGCYAFVHAGHMEQFSEDSISGKPYDLKASKELFSLLNNMGEDKGEADLAYYQKRIDACILSGADPNYRENITPLILLCRTTFKPFRKSQSEWHSNALLRVALIKKLLELPDIDANRTDDYGNTAVYYAVKAGAPIILNALLRHKEVDLNSQNSEGNTVLMDLLNQLGGRVWIDKDELLPCLDILTGDMERLNLSLSNKKGQTTSDLIDEFCEKRLPKMKKWFPDLPEIMNVIRLRVEK